MTTVTQMKCACESCLCVVDTSKAVEKEGHYYCSDACANGHRDIVKSGVRQTIKRRPVSGLLAGYPPQLVVHL